MSLVLFLAMVKVSASNDEDMHKAMMWNLEGERLYMSGNYSSAATAFQNAIYYAPKGSIMMGFAYAYKFNENFSMAIQPNVNYSALKIHPNPLANPSMTAGYPNSDNASAIGFGAQIGMYFKTNDGFKLGLSYKSPVNFNEFKFK